jgi:predicted AAA+ superfamily ATPase
LQGAALETLIYHELRIYNEVSGKHRPVYYYRTPAGVEIDFVVETAHKRPESKPRIAAIEVKRSEKWNRSWENPMRSLAINNGVTVDRMIGVYCGSKQYQFDNITVLPVRKFIDELYNGKIF